METTSSGIDSTKNISIPQKHISLVLENLSDKELKKIYKKYKNKMEKLFIDARSFDEKKSSVAKIVKFTVSLREHRWFFEKIKREYQRREKIKIQLLSIEKLKERQQKYKDDIQSLFTKSRLCDETQYTEEQKQEFMTTLQIHSELLQIVTCEIRKKCEEFQESNKAQLVKNLEATDK